MLMQPGGANGGVKPLVFTFLRQIRRERPGRFRWIVFARSELADELAVLLEPGDHLVHSYESPPAFEVLYAVFGRSPLMRQDLPCVSLVVDLLHRDLPAALPPEEVAYRHEWFTQITATARFFQCISHYTAGRLQTHYGVAPSRCFVTHIPAQQRLAEGRDQVAVPVPFAGPFLFYPANFWPHKNHETLLAAYRQYRRDVTETPWPLVFTGYPDARMNALVAHAAGLGVSDSVHFLGHLDEPAFAALWRAAGALVYPSLHEGFGIPLLEAMAFQCPIVAANTTSLPEVGGDACLYVDPRDPTAIAQALQRIAGEPALRDDLIRRGTRRLGAFSLEGEAAKLAEHLALAGRSQAATP